jgi:hypothetical protein
VSAAHLLIHAASVSHHDASSHRVRCDTFDKAQLGSIGSPLLADGQKYAPLSGQPCSPLSDVVARSLLRTIRSGFSLDRTARTDYVISSLSGILIYFQDKLA